jgi:hypothetical protein
MIGYGFRRTRNPDGKTEGPGLNVAAALAACGV